MPSTGKMAMRPSELLKILESDDKIEIGDFSDKNKLAPVYVKDDFGNKSLLVFQTPDMTAPYGVSLPYNPTLKKGTQPVKVDENAKFSLDLSFDSIDTRKSQQVFANCLKKLDEVILKTGSQRSEQWFGDKFSPEVIKKFYKYNVKPGKDKYPDTFRIKLPRKNGKFNFDVCDVNYNPLDLSSIEAKGAKVSAIIKCSGIWNVNNSFGLTFNVENLRITPAPKFNGYVFREDIDRLATPEMIAASVELAKDKKDTDSSTDVYNEDIDEIDNIENAEKKKVDMGPTFM